MDFEEALDHLERHINYPTWGAPRAGHVEGLTLDRMRALVGALGDPQHAYPVVHVTGTNGKGSTSRMITRLLGASGLTVGTYTSPHLERYNERIRIDDTDVTEDEFAEAIENVARVESLLDEQPSHFELLTAAGLAYFADRAVDVAVVEVGMLGRFDATNVADADVAVVTNIGRDHSDFEGDWAGRIAQEKAGIVKANSHLVLGPMEPRLRAIFEAEGPQSVVASGDHFDLIDNRIAVGGRLVTIQTPGQLIEELFVPLHGAHQGLNAALAVSAAETFFGRPMHAELIEGALAGLEMAGRLEVLGRVPLIVLDGAHNPDGAAAAGAVIREEFDTDGLRTLVVGMLTGRDPAEMLTCLGIETFDRVICCAPDSPRALPAQDLAAVAAHLGHTVEVAASVTAAVERALHNADPGGLVFVTGSIYTAGEARPRLRELARADKTV